MERMLLRLGDLLVTSGSDPVDLEDLQDVRKKRKSRHSVIFFEFAVGFAEFFLPLALAKES